MTDTAGDLRYLLTYVKNAVRHRYKVMLLPIVVVPIAVLVLGNHLGVKYKATAKALVQESLSVVPYRDVGRNTWTVRTSLPIVRSILKSRTTIERVLGRLGWIDENTEPAMRDYLTSAMRSRMDIYELGGGIVNISVFDKDPSVTYEVLSLLVEEMEDAIVRPQSNSLEEASNFLRGQLGALRSSLMEIEENINRFQEEQSSSKGRKHGMTLASYLEARNHLLSTDKEIRGALFEKAEKDKRSRPTDVLSKQMADARVKLGELSAIYTSNHPDVVELRNRIRSLRDAIRERDDKVKKEKQKLKGDTVGATTQDDDDVITKDLLMMRDYDVKLQSYTTLLEKYEDARVAQALSMYGQDRQILMIEEPRMPSAPLGPNKIILLAVGLMLGVMAGLSMAILLEAMSGRVKSVAEVEALTGATLLGVLPHLAKLPVKPGK